MSIDSSYNGGFEHDKTGVTMIAYILQAAESGKSLIRILTDDTDVMYLFSWYTGFGKCNCILQFRWNVGMGW